MTDIIKNKDIEKDLETEEDNKIGMEDFFKTTKEDIDFFDKMSWEKGSGYKLPSFKSIEKHLEGLSTGFYLIGAESNMGKSAFLSNLLYDICNCKDNHLFAIYYSLDDSKNDIIARVIAMNKRIPISAVYKPLRYKEAIDNQDENMTIYEDYLEKRKDGINELKDNINVFKIEDSSKIKNAKDLHDSILNISIYIKGFDEKAKIIVGIDSINDIQVTDQYFNSTVDKNTYIAKMVKSWAATEFDIPILCTIHLAKLKGNRRPELDDLRDSGEYVYEANLVWLLYNDVSKNKQNAKIFYHTSETNPEKNPIIEIDWAKNKLSSYKGRSYCYFSPEFSKMVECDEKTSERYDTLIYEI